MWGRVCLTPTTSFPCTGYGIPAHSGRPLQLVDYRQLGAVGSHSQQAVPVHSNDETVVALGILDDHRVPVRVGVHLHVMRLALAGNPGRSVLLGRMHSMTCLGMTDALDHARESLLLTADLGVVPDIPWRSVQLSHNYNILTRRPAGVYACQPSSLRVASRGKQPI